MERNNCDLSNNPELFDSRNIQWPLWGLEEHAGQANRTEIKKDGSESRKQLEISILSSPSQDDDRNKSNETFREFDRNKLTNVDGMREYPPHFEVKRDSLKLTAQEERIAFPAYAKDKLSSQRVRKTIFPRLDRQKYEEVACKSISKEESDKYGCYVEKKSVRSIFPTQNIIQTDIFSHSLLSQAENLVSNRRNNKIFFHRDRSLLLFNEKSARKLFLKNKSYPSVHLSSGNIHMNEQKLKPSHVIDVDGNDSRTCELNSVLKHHQRDPISNCLNCYLPERILANEFLSTQCVGDSDIDSSDDSSTGNSDTFVEERLISSDQSTYANVSMSKTNSTDDSSVSTHKLEITKKQCVPSFNDGRLLSINSDSKVTSEEILFFQSSDENKFFSFKTLPKFCPKKVNDH